MNGLKKTGVSGNNRTDAHRNSEQSRTGQASCPGVDGQHRLDLIGQGQDI